MHIQVNTDHHIRGSAELTSEVEAAVEHAVGWFGERITRVEVHLTDENGSQKAGNDGIRCKLEARLAGLQPVLVSADGATVAQAVAAAADKLEQTLTRTLERLEQPKGRTSYAGDQTTE